MARDEGEMAVKTIGEKEKTQGNYKMKHRLVTLEGSVGNRAAKQGFQLRNVRGVAIN